MLSKSPRRRRDEGFHSAGEDDSEKLGFRDLKKYYVYRYGCPIKDVKNKVAGKPSVLFAFFVLFIAVEIDSKLTLHYMGKVLLFNLPS